MELTNIPTVGVARYIQDLANSFGITYVPNPLDQWAETVMQLAGDEVRTDSTLDLLVALKRADKITSKELITLSVNYLRERGKSCPSKM